MTCLSEMELTGCICPICRERTATYYLDANRDIVGCPDCVRPYDAWEIVEDCLSGELWEGEYDGQT